MSILNTLQGKGLSALKGAGKGILASGLIGVGVVAVVAETGINVAKKGAVKVNQVSIETRARKAIAIEAKVEEIRNK